MSMRIVAAMLAGGLGAVVATALMPSPAPDSPMGISLLPTPSSRDVEMSSRITRSTILRVGDPDDPDIDVRSADGRLGRVSVVGYCPRWRSLQVGGIHDVVWTTWRRPDGSIINSASDTGDLELAYCN